MKTPVELLALARAQPGRITYASAGAGGISHMATELLASAARLKLVHVPYKGGSQAVTDLIGGHVDLYMGSIPQVIAHVRALKLNAIAVTSRLRSSVAPQVPTLSDIAPGYELELWWGVFAPAGVPRSVLTALNGEINKLLATPKMKAFLASEAAVPAAVSPGEFADFVSNEIEHWRKVARDAPIRLD